MVRFTFRSIEDLELGTVWAREFDDRWPYYREWFLREGEQPRPTYAASVRMLRAHMPELMPVYERLVALAGGGDLAARVLSLYKPPPFLAACSQGVWTREGGPLLVRNYDYPPSRLEGVVWSTDMLRPVIGTSDCLWGLLDGMNGDGLAVSLTFGGRRVIGDGFGIPLVVRYLLETCRRVGQAREALARLPCSLAHNLTIVDADGDVLTAYLSPDREPIFRAFPAATNHQGIAEWPEHAEATRTIERERRIVELLEDANQTVEGFADAFLRAPLFSSAYSSGWGTLYTAAYRPTQGFVDYRWPGHSWRLGFGAFEPTEHTEELAGDDADADADAGDHAG